MKKIETLSVDETVKSGFRLGKILKKGDIVCLNGGLGAGKTAFAAGIASALGVGGYVTSPTFTLVNEYKGKIPLYHFDVYRISDPEELFEIGFEEYIGGNGIVVIEWAENAEAVLPDDRIEVHIERDMDSGPDTRVITVEFNGKRYEQYENALNL